MTSNNSCNEPHLGSSTDTNRTEEGFCANNEKRRITKENASISSRIAVGSCNNQNLTQPLWDVLTSRNPTAFVWAGDAIYADYNIGKVWTKFPPEDILSTATPERLEKFYRKQLLHPAYQSFLKKSNATIFGTIDDHDMGCNNGDKDFIYKKESNIAFLNFTGENIASPIFQRALKGYGVYGVKLFDFDRENGNTLVADEEAGIDPDVDTSSQQHEISYSNKTVAIFVLDVRTNRSPWGKGWKSWSPDYDGDFLGEHQWRWFETAIKRSKASINIIVNGIQVHPYQFANVNVAE